MAIFAKVSVIRIGISRTDKNAKKETKEFRRKRQKDALDILANGPSMYGPGIDKSV